MPHISKRHPPVALLQVVRQTRFFTHPLCPEPLLVSLLDIHRVCPYLFATGRPQALSPFHSEGAASQIDLFHVQEFVSRHGIGVKDGLVAASLVFHK